MRSVCGRLWVCANSRCHVILSLDGMLRRQLLRGRTIPHAGIRYSVPDRVRVKEASSRPSLSPPAFPGGSDGREVRFGSRAWLRGGSVGKLSRIAWLYIGAVIAAAVVVIARGPFAGIDWAQVEVPRPARRRLRVHRHGAEVAQPRLVREQYREPGRGHPGRAGRCRDRRRAAHCSASAAAPACRSGSSTPACSHSAPTWLGGRSCCSAGTWARRDRVPSPALSGRSSAPRGARDRQLLAAARRAMADQGTRRRDRPRRARLQALVHRPRLRAPSAADRGAVERARAVHAGFRADPAASSPAGPWRSSPRSSAPTRRR